MAGRVATLVELFERLSDSKGAKNPPRNSDDIARPVASGMDVWRCKALMSSLQREDITTRAERRRLRRISTEKQSGSAMVNKQPTPSVAQLYEEHVWAKDFRRSRPAH